MTMSDSSKIVLPRVKIHNGIIKNAEKVEMVVMVKLKFKLPPNMTVQILEAPPPGDAPVTNKPNRIEGLSGNMNPNPKPINGMIKNWEMNPMAGPTGRRKVSFTTPISAAQPMLI